MAEDYMATETSTQIDALSDRDKVLSEVQDRVLWLGMQMVHHANNVRENPDGLKVGGHQASSASVATIMTSLYFDFMNAGDSISIKPHASPVFHAIQFILGNLDERYLKSFRAFHGLQAYPSRTKDPDGVDFSTGSVGLGAVAPNFSALAAEYVQTHLHPEAGPGAGADRRYISVVGDAELDEGSVWEAIAEPEMNGLANILWVVDLNRQSLDRVIPGIRVRSWRDMFAANGWQVIDAKYGKRLQSAFAEPNGELLRTAIDEMSNNMYQRLLRVSPEVLREWLPRTSRHPSDLERFISRWDDEELQDLVRNLGGHDFSMLREAFGQADLNAGPNVVFAYTLKGWRLPSVGDPQNHSVTLSPGQMAELQTQLEVPEGEVWSGFAPHSPAGKLCADTGAHLRQEASAGPTPAELSFPSGFGRTYSGNMSTQQIFGLVLTDIGRSLPEVAHRMVTVSPDVASSTNLGGWMNKVGVWARTEKEEMPEEGIVRALRWEESLGGQHIELGISENNLFMMLGQLGLSHEMNGELLFPIGTLYDPFVRRGLDAFVYSVYSGARFIAVGTPSGISLAPEGGAHQSMVTPSIGAELPDLAFYEPCFGQELEWIILDALRQIYLRKHSTYLRLTSSRVDQTLFTLPPELAAQERIRRQVLAGAYRLLDRRGEDDYRLGNNVVHLFASGVVVPEAVKASDRLLEEGVMANVINVTGPGPLYSSFQDSVHARMRGEPYTQFMGDVIPTEDRGAPAVTVVDGHPHSLAWVGSALETATSPLGVTEFGQSGSRPDLYREYEIDADSIMSACFAALES
jgi:pyruvate dehydrogenase E1 component